MVFIVASFCRFWQNDIDTLPLIPVKGDALMILYPNDRKLLRFLRDKQSNERSFFFISNDYTFCIPIDKPKDSTLSQEAINELRHYNFPLEPPEVEGSLIALESNGCLYHPGGQYVRITSYGWRCAYLSRVTISSLNFSLFFIAPSYSPYTCSTSANNPAPINNAPITPTMVIGMS